jgi:hypothetical protein
MAIWNLRSHSVHAGTVCERSAGRSQASTDQARFAGRKIAIRLSSTIR